MYKKEVQNIHKAIRNYSENGKAMFVTSSFQTHSLPLLHIVAQVDKSIPIYFINTGFLFPETLEYRDEVANVLDINLINIRPDIAKHLQKDADGRFKYTSNPDSCCNLNKVLPLEPLLAEHDVWINGVRADQSDVRKSFEVEEETKFNAVRYHPMLNWTPKMIFDYIKDFELPHHPLDAQGYQSIGCVPCTRKFDFLEMGDDRNARWYGMNKVECGLHTELTKK